MKAPGTPSLRVLLGSAMGLRLAMAVLNFSLFWLLSHRLSTEALGGFSVLMNLFLLVQLLPLLGLSMPLIRRAASEREQLGAEMSNAFALALPVAGLIALVLVAVGHWHYPPELFLPFLLLAATLLPGAWTLVAECSLLGLERMTDIARVQCAEVLARVLLSVLVVELGYGLTGVFAVLLLLRLVVAGVYLRLPGLPRPQRALLSRDILRRNLKEVPMFFGIAVLAALSARLDVLVLSRVQGLAEVGVYASAARLYDAALMLPTVAALTMMPTLARLFTQEPAQFRSLLRQALSGSLAVGAVVALAVAALSPWVIGWLYRPEMAAAAPVLAWLIFAAVLTTVDQVLSSTMLAAKAQAEDMKALGAAVAVLLLALIGLASAFGPVGAAAAVVLGQCLRVLLRLRWAVRSLGLDGLWRECGLQLLAALAGVAALLLAWRFGPVASWAAAWAAWWAMARLTGLLGPHWWHAARDALLRLRGRAPA